MTPLERAAKMATDAMHAAGVFETPAFTMGTICNELGDLEIFGRPTMEGLIGLPIAQALAALPHGWRWVESYDFSGEQWIGVQRGGTAWRVRR